MSEPKNESLQIFGSLVAGFAQACVNLNIVAGQRAGRLLSNYEFGAWYPYERLRELERTVIDSYTRSEPILERVGIEMMKAWYTFGPGKEFIKRGEDFLHFQTGSLGYASVVKGPPEQVGLFVLEHIDSEAGRARILSTTPFDKHLERGVLIGGMSAPGDLDFVDVVYDPTTHRYLVEYH